MIKKIIVADDHPLFLSALCKCLSQAFTGIEIIQAHDMESLQAEAQAHPDSDLLLLDLYMPGCQGFSGLLHINASYAQLPVILISANEKREVMQRAIAYGAAGFLPKSAPAETIVEAISAVVAGGVWTIDSEGSNSHYQYDSENDVIYEAVRNFTAQQYRVAMMLVSGLANKQIAYEMNITEATVKAHLTLIFRKLKVSSRTLAVLALKQLDADLFD